MVVVSPGVSPLEFTTKGREVENKTWVLWDLSRMLLWTWLGAGVFQRCPL